MIELIFLNAPICTFNAHIPPSFLKRHCQNVASNYPNNKFVSFKMERGLDQFFEIKRGLDQFFEITIFILVRL